MCVSQNTLGCTSQVKSFVETTFVQVQAVVEQVCTPPVVEEPSLQCYAMAGEETPKGCDVSGAAQCMYNLYSELMCDRPDYKMICP